MTGIIPPLHLVINTKDARISRDEAFMAFAQIISARSTCRRLHVGAIITNSVGTQVVALGYNGSIRGQPNDCDSDEPGNCGCIHAETNALIKAAPDSGNVMYITHAPCVRCSKLIANSGIRRVVYFEAYRIDTGVQLLERLGIEVVKLGAATS